MLGSSLLGDLAGSTPANNGGGTPGAPDNPRSASALSAMIVAGHAFLRTERDPQDRAAVTGCLAKLESIRGKKMPGQNQNSQGSSGGSGY